MLIALCLACYFNSVSAPFVFDDVAYIVENPAIRSVWNFFDAGRMSALYIPKELVPILKGRPLGFLSFALNYKLGGLNPTGYHMVNILIHIVNTLLVYALMRRILRVNSKASMFIAFAVAALFACHPIQTQAVIYTTQRFATLAAMFYLGSITAYAASRQGGRKSYATSLYAISFICALLAMKSKETAFTLPVMIALYEVLFHDGPYLRRLLRVLPFAAAMLIVPLARMELSKPLMDSISATASQNPLLSRGTYLITQTVVLARYLALLAFPAGQNLDYDFPLYSSIFDHSVIGSGLALMALAAVGVKGFLLRDYWRWRVACFGIGWFFIAISVESSVIPMVDYIFEHRMYLPVVGLFMAIAVGSSIWIDRKPRALYALLAMVLIMLSALTVARGYVWADEVRLWQDVVSKSPLKARPHNSLGLAFQKAGELEKARAELEASIDADRNYYEAHLNLGNVLKEMGRRDEALKTYEEAVRLRPNEYKAYNNIGIILLDQDRLGAAQDAFGLALKINPQAADTLNNMGNTCRLLGQYADAERYLREAIRLDPLMGDAHFNLGLVMGQQKRMEESLSEFKEALRLDPSNYAAQRYIDGFKGQIAY